MRVTTLLGLLGLLVAPAHGDELEDLYHQAVAILGGNESVVSRWEGGIRFAVIGGDEATSAAAREVVTEAASIAGLEVSFPSIDVASAADYVQFVRQTRPHFLSDPCTDDPREPCFNFVVLFADYDIMHELSEAIPLHPLFHGFLDADPTMACFFSPFHIGRQSIWQALVYIRNDLSPDLRQTCLQEEIYQSLGLFNDYTDSTLFSFNNVVAPKRITKYDRALLAALYDPRVKSGYPVNLVVRIFLENLERKPLGL